MSCAPALAPAVRPTPFSIPVRNLFLTLLLTALCFAICGSLWGHSGYDILLVGMGWPHTIFGFLFYFGKVLRNDPAARSSFLVSALLTAVLWFLHYQYYILIPIQIYFTYHALRDEVFMYLQTRSSHREKAGPRYVPGVLPLILLLLLLPKWPEANDGSRYDFGRTLRRVELRGSEIASDGWMLVRFPPLASSGGREWYLQLQASGSDSYPELVAFTAVHEPAAQGMTVNGRLSSPPGRLMLDLVYGREANATPPGPIPHPQAWQVRLTGGHRVGQTFLAAHDQLSGIRVPMQWKGGRNDALRMVVRLERAPLVPFSVPVDSLKLAAIAVLSIAVFRSLAGGWRRHAEMWVYLGIFSAALTATAAVLLSRQIRGQYALPFLFQFIVVFHYISWYVFTFDKLGAGPSAPLVANSYDRVLVALRSPRNFAVAMLLLNGVFLALAFWYYRLQGPPWFRYAFAVEYFIYALVFHVSFSFGHHARWRTGDRS